MPSDMLVRSVIVYVLVALLLAGCAGILAFVLKTRRDHRARDD